MKQRFLHVWHGDDKTIIDNAIDDWRGRRALCAGKRRTLRGTIGTLFSHVTENVLVFFKCDTIFRFFFGKLPQV